MFNHETHSDVHEGVLMPDSTNGTNPAKGLSSVSTTTRTDGLTQPLDARATYLSAGYPRECRIIDFRLPRQLEVSPR
jgi:hypothetical protein